MEVEPRVLDIESGFQKDLPPGTVRISDAQASHIVLSPQPSSDPNDPLNWSMSRKVLQISLLCFYTMMVFACVTVATPLWAPMNAELGFSYGLLNDSYAANVAALSVGCVFFVPFALKYGRRPVYLVTGFVMAASAVWMAKTYTVGDLVGTNVLSGLAGAVNETLFQVTVADLFFVHQRGTVNGIYLVVVVVGNYLGPVASGYVGASQGWRWSFWWCAIFLGSVSVIMVFLLEETKYSVMTLEGYPQPVDSSVDETKALETQSKDKMTTNPQSIDGADSEGSSSPDVSQRRRSVPINTAIPMKNYWQRHSFYKMSPSSNKPFLEHFFQPFIVLFTFPAVTFAAFQYGFCLCALAILAVTQAILFPSPPYNFSTIGIGNIGIPPAIGSVLGSIYGGVISDHYILWRTKKNGGIYEPEMRLHLFILPALCMPAGILLYGLAVAKGMAWIITCIGAGFIGFAIGGIADLSLTYVQDCYKEILGDALVGVAFVRNILATILVFVITPWMTNMGVYNMFVLLGCVSIAVVGTFIPVMIWGKTFRIKCASAYEAHARKQFDVRGI